MSHLLKITFLMQLKEKEIYFCHKMNDKNEIEFIGVRFPPLLTSK